MCPQHALRKVTETIIGRTQGTHNALRNLGKARK